MTAPGFKKGDIVQIGGGTLTWEITQDPEWWHASENREAGFLGVLLESENTRRRRAEPVANLRRFTGRTTQEDA